jgi:AraC-like DNA-binding protein
MSLDELSELLAGHARPDMSTRIEDVLIFKAERPYPPVTMLYGKMFTLIAQGTKRVGLGDHIYEYRAGQYLVTSVDLPLTSHFTEAGEGRPGLGVGLALRPSAVAEVLLQAGSGDPPAMGGAAPSGLGVSTASPELLDAIVRLVRLLDRPDDITVLAPLIKREILWRLITGEQGGIVRQFGLPDSKLNNIARAIKWIHNNYARPFRVDDVARLAGMSVSAFHRNFQSVTGMSPIQFQKQIRLQRARLLLAGNPGDIAGVSRRVGYDSPSQFSREYRRQFGAPPSKDTAVFHSATRPASRNR